MAIFVSIIIARTFHRFRSKCALVQSRIHLPQRKMICERLTPVNRRMLFSVSRRTNLRNSSRGTMRIYSLICLFFFVLFVSFSNPSAVFSFPRYKTIAINNKFDCYSKWNHTNARTLPRPHCIGCRLDSSMNSHVPVAFRRSNYCQLWMTAFPLLLFSVYHEFIVTKVLLDKVRQFFVSLQPFQWRL